MCPLDRLHVQIQNAIVGADSGVAGVCQRAGLAIAETGNLDGINKRKFWKGQGGGGRTNIVLVSAKILAFGCSVGT